MNTPSHLLERIATVNQDETARYTDHEYDTFTGWNYMKARFSTPAAAGKFNRPDPARDWDWTTPGSLNLYQYVRNNPITGYDPTGLEILLDPDMEPHVREFLLRDLRSLTNDDVSFEGNKFVLKINKSGDLPTGTELLRYLTGTEQTVTLAAHSITDEEDNKDPEPSHVFPVPISMDAVTPGKGSGSRVTIDYSNLSVAKTYDS